ESINSHPRAGSKLPPTSPRKYAADKPYSAASTEQAIGGPSKTDSRDRTRRAARLATVKCRKFAVSASRSRTRKFFNRLGETAFRFRPQTNGVSLAPTNFAIDAGRRRRFQ